MTALPLFSKKNTEKNLSNTPPEIFDIETQQSTDSKTEQGTQHTPSVETEQTQYEQESNGREQQTVSGESSIDTLRSTLRASRKKPTAPITIVRDEITLQVEKIMEQGLVDAFKKMTRVQQQEFKMKGEETAQQIRDLLRKTKVKMGKIFRLIFNWLKLLPGVNKYFIEQEAKIKAEQILRLKDVFTHTKHQ